MDCSTSTQPIEPLWLVTVSVTTILYSYKVNNKRKNAQNNMTNTDNPSTDPNPNPENLEKWTE